MKKDSIGNRMKSNYENRSRYYLTRRIPVIMRLDGRAFHTLTKKHCNKPFDINFSNSMKEAAREVLNDIMGAQCAYIQSDEVTILITDFDKLNTEAWFDYNIQKMVSISSSLMSLVFTRVFTRDFTKFLTEDTNIKGIFDCRVFNIPKEEVCNNFIWRQQDWHRNSISMYTASFYSQKEMHKKNTKDMHEMLHKKGVNWAELPDRWKNGVFIGRKVCSSNDRESFLVWEACPIFTKNRQIIEQYLVPSEE